MRQKHLLILFLLAIPLLGYNQSPCKTEFCRTIQAKIAEIEGLKRALRDKDAQIRGLNAIIAHQKQIIQSQQKTINTLKQIIFTQKKTIDSLIAAGVKNAALRKQAEDKLKEAQESITRMDVENARLNKEIEEDRIQIQSLTREKDELNKLLNGIKFKNFVFDSTYIVPYGLSIGPISFNNELNLDPPDSDAKKFLNQLQKVNKDVEVIIEINVEGKRREEKKLRDTLFHQVQDYCPTCNFQFRFIPEKKDQIFFKLYHKTYSPPPRP